MLSTRLSIHTHGSFNTYSGSAEASVEKKKVVRQLFLTWPTYLYKQHLTSFDQIASSKTDKFAKLVNYRLDLIIQ